jgi:hypothetical protein
LTALKDNRQVFQFDTLKVISYLASFKRINYESLIMALEKSIVDSITSSKPAFIMTLQNKNGETKEIKAWRRKSSPGEVDIEGNPTVWDRDRMYARLTGSNELVFIQYFVFDPILRPLQWFTGEKLVNPEKE